MYNTIEELGEALKKKLIQILVRDILILIIVGIIIFKIATIIIGGI